MSLNSFTLFDDRRLAAEWHETIFDVILVLAGLHVAAVVFYLVRKRQNLIAAMISGYCRQAPGEAAAPAVCPLWRLLVGIGLAGLVVWAVTSGFWI